MPVVIYTLTSDNIFLLLYEEDHFGEQRSGNLTVEHRECLNFRDGDLGGKKENGKVDIAGAILRDESSTQ